MSDDMQKPDGRPSRSRVSLVLEDAGEPGDAPFAVRVRHTLKRALRGDSLRCVSAVITGPAPVAPREEGT